MASFVKILTESDFNYKLSVPWTLVPHVNSGKGGELRAVDDHTGRVYQFFLSFCQERMDKENKKKPVLHSHGWLMFVDDKKLQVGDTIYFWQDEWGNFRVEAYNFGE